MERAKRSWNAPLGQLEQSLQLYLERALAQMERPLGASGTEPQALLEQRLWRAWNGHLWPGSTQRAR